MKYIFYIFIALFFIGCSTKYPMGLNEDQWSQLGSQEQLELTKQQQMLDHELQLQREKQKEIALQIQLKEQERIDKLYQNTTIGDIVVVNFESGDALSSKEKLPIIPQGVVLARGETKEIELQLLRGNHTRVQRVYLHYTSQATQVEVSLSPPSQRVNKIVLLNNGRWVQSTKYPKQNLEVSKYSGLYNLRLSVRYHEATLKSKESYILIPR